MNISVPNPEKNYKVLVRCITYNHSKFICDALNGFSIQETDFPFICIVVDDASKDGTQDVIKQYANDNCDMSKSEISEDNISVYIRVPHKINTNCVFLFCLLKLNLYGKPEKQEIYKPYRVVCEYEALCEGDDYWTDPLKLQKQVDFLEMNPEYSMCFHSAKIINELGIADKISGVVEEREYTANEVFKQWTAPTASLLFKREIYDLPMNNRYKPLYGDIVLLLKAAKCGKLKGMSDQMSVYRVHSGGVTYDKTRRKGFAKRLPEHFLYIRDNFGEMLDKKILNKTLAGAYRWRCFCFPQRMFLSKDLFYSFILDPTYIMSKF